MNTANRIGRLRAALRAIAFSLDDHELRLAAREELEADDAAAELVAAHPAEMMDTEVQTAHPVVGLSCKDLQTALSRWIPVMTPPETWTEVMVWPQPSDQTMTAVLGVDGRWRFDEYVQHHGWVSEKMSTPPTHWMPLPLPPGESAEAVPSNEKAPAVGVGSPVSTAMEVPESGAAAPPMEREKFDQAWNEHIGKAMPPMNLGGPPLWHFRAGWQARALLAPPPIPAGQEVRMLTKDEIRCSHPDYMLHDRRGLFIAVILKFCEVNGLKLAPATTKEK